MSRRKCCKCGGPCCARQSDLFADVTFGTLDGMANVKINQSTETECTGVSDGWYGDPVEAQQSLDGWERPETAVPIPPIAAPIVHPVGSWERHTYEPGMSFQKYSSPNEGCYGYFGQDLLMKQTGISGNVEAVTGNEPLNWPYFVRLSQSTYVDTEGDCILRIVAELQGRDDKQIYEPPGKTYIYTDKDFVGNSSERARSYSIDISPYSDFNPCYEDGPVDLGAGGIGPRINSRLITLLSFNYLGAGAPPDSSDPSLQQNDFESAATPAAYALVWEINLTDAGISDLSNLPATVLNSGNLAGVIPDGSPTGDVEPVPADLHTHLFRYHVAGSYGTAWSDVSETPDAVIYNTPSAHVCEIDAREGTSCNISLDWQEYRRIKADFIKWRVTFRLENATVDVALTDIALTLKPSAT